MPESKRTICALSAPVTVFQDEFMAELVQKLPKEDLASLIQGALLRSQDRLMAQTVRNRRSDAYKAVLLARGLAERLRPIPPALAVLLGEMDASKAPVEGMTVEPAVADPEEDFAANIDIPEFKQYASVFNTYPYVEVRETESYGRLLVLGYCSGRGRHSNQLYRRNCVIVRPNGRRQGFRDLSSVLGVLSDVGPDGTHYTIKAIPYEAKTAVKCWTNLVGKGDIPDQYRYMIFGKKTVTTYSTEAAWESEITLRANPLKSSGDDISPTPLQG